MGIEPTPHSRKNSTISPSGGAETGAPATESPLFAPDLMTVVDAWPTLPEAIRAGILAMVRAAAG
jgi:hypothetical protein